MTRIIISLTFIPWILYLVSSSSRVIKEFRGQKINKEFLKNNLFNLFRLDTIILVLIFIFFSITYPSADQIWLIRVLLFISINLYLLLNSIYDKKNKEKLLKKEYNIIFLLVILMLIPIVFYLISKKYTTAYYIMFGYSILNGLIVLLCSIINNKINKLKKKHEKYL
ncbi:MAG: hypothetical protein ACI4OP_04395 [Candidatus Coprovivens sp.]